MSPNTLPALALLVAALTLSVAAPAIAKLPPPTPEEQAKMEAAKAKAKAQEAKDNQELQQAQDRVVQFYLTQRAAKAGKPAESQGTPVQGNPGEPSAPAAKKD